MSAKPPTFQAVLTVADFDPEAAPRITRHAALCIELRTKMTAKLRELVGDDKARLYYAAKRYAKFIVVARGLRLVGWPSDVVYINFSNIHGGSPVLERLLHLWDEGTIRFEHASAEDVAAARRDPRSVHPSPPQSAPRDARDARDATVVPAVALHPSSLRALGVQLTSTQPSAAADAPACPHIQRWDTKVPRNRKLGGPYCRKRVLPKEGIKSAAYVLDSDGEDAGGAAAGSQRGSDGLGRFCTTDEPVGSLLPVTEEGWHALATAGMAYISAASD